MSNSFDKMVKEFKDYAELLEFSKAQHKTIVDLTRKVQKLEAENKRTKKLLPEEKKSEVSSPSVLLTSDEEIICRTQLNMLRDVALERELTLEEAKKVDMYSKILIALQDKPKTIEVKTKGMSDDELLALASDDEQAK